VITDLMNGALAASVPPPDENWARDPGEPAGAASEMPHPGSAEPVQGDSPLVHNLIPIRNAFY
jgi:hypothetical protein